MLCHNPRARVAAACSGGLRAFSIRIQRSAFVDPDPLPSHRTLRSRMVEPNAPPAPETDAKDADDDAVVAAEVEPTPAETGEDGGGGAGPPGDAGGGEPPRYLHSHQVTIEDEMRSSYVDYAMSVIVGRALPDVRDGLKPVHRRVLFTQHQMRNNWNSAYKKSARIVGDCIGKYHPHGDTAVYDTLVRMAQEFSLRLPLVDGQGNFGSIDGDPPAAMRYTEVRMTRVAHELLADLDKNTVDFQENYDGHDEEPTVLPSRVPNLLVNGSGGIAVGMATNIPPHNLAEVVDATVALIEDPEIDVAGLMTHVEGPDFPTGGTIYGREGIWEAYTTGRGKLRVRAKTHFEEKPNGREVIIVDELPYQVNKAKLIEYIAHLVRDKRVEGIADLRDESDRHGIRVVIECKRDAMAQVVLNHLYRLTNLQTTFGVINLAIVAGQPVVLGLKEMLRHFIDHRREVVTRRCLYELAQAEARAHILEGLLIALDEIDAVITMIRESPDAPTAKAALMSNFALSERQSQAILDMRLQRLTGLERDKIRDEYDDLQGRISYLNEVLADDGLLMGIIKGELETIKADYANPRRTHIVDDEGSIRMEDLIADEDMVVTLTSDGYVKRTPVSAYRAQRRGGRGKTGMATKQEDMVRDLFVSSAHQPILFFTSRGRAFSLKTYELPAGTAATRGKPVINLLPVEKDEDVRAVLPVRTFDDPDASVVLATRNGRVKRTVLGAYGKIRSSGIIGLVLEENDDLIDVRLVYPDSTILLATRKGMAIHFQAQYRQEGNRSFGLRPMGRVARGVRGIKLRDGDEVVSLAVLNTAERNAALAELGAEADEDEGADEAGVDAAAVEGGAVDESAVEESADDATVDAAGGDESDEDGDAEESDEAPYVVLTISENGFGKLTSPSNYRLQGRGGLGLIDLKVTEKGKPTKTGNAVGLRIVRRGSQVLLVTDGGKLIRTQVDQIRQVARNAMGVKVINLEVGEKVVSFDVLVEDDEDDLDDEELAAADEASDGEAGDDEVVSAAEDDTGVDDAAAADDGDAGDSAEDGETAPAGD